MELSNQCIQINKNGSSNEESMESCSDGLSLNMSVCSYGSN